jgi:hypothetical protein
MSKSRIEYLEILSLDESATTEEIKARFNELYSDFQIRLTNAPTPNLKKLYQKNLQELEETFAILTNQKVTGQPKTDLPSSKPTQNAQAGPSEPSNKRNGGENTHPSNPQVIAGRGARTTAPAAMNNNDKSSISSGISFNIFVITVVVAVAGIALLATLYFDGKNEVVEMQKEAAKNQDFLKFKDIFKNGKFKVENRTDQTITVLITHITFFDNQGQLKEFKFLGTNGNPKSVQVVIEPGKNVSINQYDGPVKWDGSVVSYAMLVYANGNSSTPSAVYSGIWLHEWPENKLVITF